MKTPGSIMFVYARAWAIGAVIITAISVFTFSSGQSTMLPGSSFPETKAVISAGRSGRNPGATHSRGVFLIANKNIGDPRFRETVIFLISLDERGAMGVIINRPTKITIPQALPGMESNDLVYAGGPVALNQLLILVRFGSQPGKAFHLFDSVYITSDTSDLGQLINEPKGEGRFRVYAGYAGWAPGQLEREIARSDWLTTEADSALIFDKPASSVWRELIEKKSAIEVMHRENKLPQRLSDVRIDNQKAYHAEINCQN
ncbi:MAG: YqgE/AlgH family protein [Nitrospirae bacterium]|nr:YqgE/AlgH family protein [Nitrospirota bacterium]